MAIHKTLGASVADTVTLRNEYDYVDVLNRSLTGAGIFVSVAPAGVPAVAGDDTYVVQPGRSVRIPTPGVEDDNTVVNLISATADPYSVVGVPVV